jgi:hypothetical protein
MSLTKPSLDSDLPGPSAADPGDRSRPKLPRPVLAIILTLVAVSAIGLVFVGVRIYQRDYTAIPFEKMHFLFRDENGEASIVSSTFVIAYEGHSDPRSVQGGGFYVDGRQAPNLWRAEKVRPHTYKRKGVTITYSPRRRLNEFDFHGHHAEYIHHQHKLTVNGHEFSTANGQVRLLIKPTGEVQRLDTPPK